MAYNPEDGIHISEDNWVVLRELFDNDTFYPEELREVERTLQLYKGNAENLSTPVRLLMRDYDRAVVVLSVSSFSIFLLGVGYWELFSSFSRWGLALLIFVIVLVVLALLLSNFHSKLKPKWQQQLDWEYDPRHVSSYGCTKTVLTDIRELLEMEIQTLEIDRMVSAASSDHVKQRVSEELLGLLKTWLERLQVVYNDSE